MTFLYEDPYDGTIQGHYTMEVTPPTSREPNVTVKVTGSFESACGTIADNLGPRGTPSFSEYIMLTDKEFYIGGPLPGNGTERLTPTSAYASPLRTSSTSSRAQATSTRSTIRRTAGPPFRDSESRKLWKTGQPKIDFNTVTADPPSTTGDISQESGVNLPYTTTTPQRETGLVHQTAPQREV